ncbi:RNA polymerase sigma factor, sigma-70 family [Fodinibius salinus]|uniref:RNA polymerase sigma factor, sigma-70 family n=1 Tax=Fodinibius salinus TaxID=860790 RepID=A0A5D3YGJ9_9BACT|nr:sigma-70 family RNA polymerase sigma factor [Fodinibius salinus]TYP92551.1 RNA polymerase sigma factor, sigma-70 family [Fodinibius salinus]
MATSRSDYSELIEAIKQNKHDRTNELLQDITSRLRDYLQVVMSADKVTADEVTQRALLEVYERIEADKIQDSRSIYSYLLRTTRNEFLQFKREQGFLNTPLDEAEDHFVDPAEQFQNLLDEERQQILEICMDELKERSRKLIDYFFDNPDTTTKEASEEFGISGANVRTRKSRILSRLHECYKRKRQQ